MTSPGSSAAPPVLTLGPGLRIRSLTLVERSGEVEELHFDHSAVTVITGQRNTSKTTTLRLIDYCLGEKDGPDGALGHSVAEKYDGVVLTISLNGSTRSLRRSFNFGEFNRIWIDGDDVHITAADFSNWILQELGWPRLEIPFGVSGTTAKKLVPLTFRSLQRHIYRKEDSWTEFATKEQDYLRIAVQSYLLGFAEFRYDNYEFDLAQAERRLVEAEAIERDVRQTTGDAVRALGRQLGLPEIEGPESIPGAEDSLRRRLSALQGLRATIFASQVSREPGEDPAGYDPNLTSEYESVGSRLISAANQVGSLRTVVGEYMTALALARADRGRLSRLQSAIAVFDELPVRVCPACEQNVDPRREHESAHCYLCDQHVEPDRRQRRAELEQRTLDAEISELEDVLARTQIDLSAATTLEATLSVRHRDLAGRLNDSRAANFAPYVAALEDAASEAAKINQQLAALPAISEILLRRVRAQSIVVDARHRLAELSKLEGTRSSGLSLISERCSVFADTMNTFLKRFGSGQWIGKDVAISAQDMVFYVGTRPWDQQLGAESRVLFFLAYSYALVSCLDSLGPSSRLPGLLLLDNPYQHDLADSTVRAALDLICFEADRVGAQVIVTQSRESDLAAPHLTVEMKVEYAGDDRAEDR